ncbi:MAG: thioredoxin family protein, partial [Betaproteobacteria bacterium]|nr:thioredoxin family protein [Betaproteobacteria bacterium]
WHLARKAKAIEGQAVPELEPAVEASLRERGKVLLYFFSPHCGPCRTVTPVIDRLAALHDNVFKFDASQSLDLARRLGVMATPTMMLLADGRIAHVKLGTVSAQRIEALLE